MSNNSTKFSYFVFKKSKPWVQGPWTKEPDLAYWNEFICFSPCLILRHPKAGHLNGYVGVPPLHPWFEVPYMELDLHYLVHTMGLTYSNYGSNFKDVLAPYPSLAAIFRADYWWLGFSCSHVGDMPPEYATKKRLYGEKYRSFSYVKKECTLLARQALFAATS